MTLDQALAELQNPDPRVHLRAIRWLRVIDGPQAVAALIDALDHPSADVHSRAAEALGDMRAREAVPALIERFQRDLPGIERANAIKALARIGDRTAVPALIAALSHPSEWVTEEACRALATLGDHRAVEPLLRVLEHPDWSIRYRTCSALITLRVTDERLDPVLDQLARERESEEYRRWLRELQRELARLRGVDDGGGEAPPSEEEREHKVEAAIAELRDPDPQIRERAVLRLREPGAPRAIAALIAALEDPAPRVRWGAALALGGAAVPEALPVLTEHLLGDESPGVRQMCAVSLGWFKDDRAAEALLQALADPHAPVVEAASIGLGRRGDQSAIPSLLPLLDHPERRIRYWSARALLDLQTADQRLVAALEGLARDPEAEEHDLQAKERNYRLVERAGSLDLEPGSTELGPHLTMAELVAQARQILAQEEP
jgi:HEAT repeat protein